MASVHSQPTIRDYRNVAILELERFPVPLL
jgi:hypothetical protein